MLDNEYYKARDIMKLLGYEKWDNFKNVIDRAQLICNISNNNVSTNFEIIKYKVDGKLIVDYKLSKYALYLILQNADSRKKPVALLQNQFTPQINVLQNYDIGFTNLTEDEKRVYIRFNIKNKNRFLFREAKKSGVIDFSKFNDHGYMGLYNGEMAMLIAKRKELDYRNQNILDYMGSKELSLNLFRITQTEEALKDNYIKSESNACIVHYDTAKAVRDVSLDIYSSLPENLPNVNEPIKNIEKRLIKELKK